MANSRAQVEARGSYRDEMTTPMQQSLDRLAARFGRFQQSMQRALTVAKAWAAVKLTGKFFDWIEKYTTGDTHTRFVDSQQRLFRTFRSVGSELADRIAPSVMNIADQIATIVNDHREPLIATFEAVAGLVEGITRGLTSVLGLLKEIEQFGRGKDAWDKLSPAGRARFGNDRARYEDYLRKMGERQQALGDSEMRRLMGERGEYATKGGWDTVDFGAWRKAVTPIFSKQQPLVRSGGVAHKAAAPAKQEVSVWEALAERWTISTKSMNEELFRLVLVFEDELTEALTDVITRTKSAKEAFIDFANAVYRQVVRLLVETGVRGVLGSVTGIGGFGGGGGAASLQGMGPGGGAGVVFNIQNLNAIEPQSFAEAAARSEHLTGYQTALMLRSSQRRSDVKARFNLRRRR